MMGAFDSPFIIPVAGIAIGAIAIISGTASTMQARHIKAMQQSEMLARGLSAADVERLLNIDKSSEPITRDPFRTRDPYRSMANARRAAIVLCSSGIGIIFFFVALLIILGEKEVLCGAATGLVPLMIGIGFFIDYYLQKRELAGFASKLEADTLS